MGAGHGDTAESSTPPSPKALSYWTALLKTWGLQYGVNLPGQL